jgi:anti-sigma factor RsiW
LNCEEIQVLLHGYLDSEIDLVRGLEIERHLHACSACSALLEKYQRLRTALQSPQLYHRAPEQLRERIESSFRRVRTLPRTSRSSASRWLAIAASIALVAFGTWGLIRVLAGPSGRDLLIQEVVAGHIRSLSTSPLTAVASSDQHTVKPWFSGKLNFSPVVKDFAEEGFPLVGGRLDYLDDRKVTALVYKHRQHVINLFEWPADSDKEQTPQTSKRQGFNLISWQKNGLVYWAISDLNEEELNRFARLAQRDGT